METQQEMSEQNIMRRIMLALSKHGVTIFRNNTGTGWVGDAERVEQPRKMMIYPGDVVLRAARPLHAGLCTGSSDLIGWRRVTITPDMVGNRIAVFTAIETKNKNGRVSDEQKKFIFNVASAGGHAGVARDEKDALDICAIRCDYNNEIKNQ